MRLGPVFRGVRVVVVLSVVASTARAGLDDQAASAMRAADKSTRACDIAGALVKYRRVYDRTQHADALLKMAAAQRLIGRKVAAAKNYESYLRHPGADPAEKPKVKENLAEIDKEIGRLRVRTGNKGEVFVDGSGEGEGAEVRVRVDPGHHAVTVERDGVIHAAAAVTVKAGEERVVALGNGATSRAPEPEPPIERTMTGDIAKQADLLKKACKLLEAIDRYRAAQARAPDPKVAKRMADALERAGRPSRAADAYEESARLKPSRARRSLRAVRKLRPQVDHVRISPPIQAGARLLVDGGPVALAEAGWVRLDPGPHAALLEEEGAIRAAASFTAVAGGQTEVTLRSVGGPAPSPAASAGAGAGIPGLSPPSAPGVSPSSEGSWPEPAAASPPGAASPSWAAEGESGDVDSDGEYADADVTEEARRLPIAEEQAGHEGQLSVLLHGDTNARTGDMGPTVGVAFGVGPLFEVSAVALFQELSGARIAAALFLLSEPAIKPFVRAGLPIFSQDDLHMGIHAGVGVVWDFLPITGISLDFAVERFSTMPERYSKTYAIVSAGVQVRTP